MANTQCRISDFHCFKRDSKGEIGERDISYTDSLIHTQRSSHSAQNHKAAYILTSFPNIQVTDIKVNHSQISKISLKALNICSLDDIIFYDNVKCQSWFRHESLKAWTIEPVELCF